MNGCSRLEEYLTNRLEGAALAAFSGHLERCAECRSQVDAWRGIARSIGDWAADRTMPAPTPGEAARLVVGLGPKRARIGWRMPVVYAGLAAVSAVAVVFVALYQAHLPEREAAPTAPAPVVQAEPPKPAAPAASLAPAEPAPNPVRIQLLYSRSSEILRPKDGSAEQLSVPGRGALLAALGEDRVALGSGSRVEVLQALPGRTRLRLLQGRVVAEVARRGEGGFFEVEAGGLLIRVVGTRFAVDIAGDSGVRVGVSRGAVAVAGPEAERHEVREGQSLAFGKGRTWHFAALTPRDRTEIGAALTAPPGERKEKSDESDQSDESDESDKSDQILAVQEPEPVAPEAAEEKAAPGPDLATWRKWVLTGDRDAAERAMVDYLQKDPADVSVWSLLAVCRRRSEDWTGAVDALRQVIARGNGRVANQARFEAAAVLQDKLGQSGPAAALLAEYLRAPLLLEAEAMVRLARAYAAEGQNDKARRLLDQVVAEHGSTSAAIEAKRLLEAIRGAKR